MKGVVLKMWGRRRMRNKSKKTMIKKIVTIPDRLLCSQILQSSCARFERKEKTELIKKSACKKGNKNDTFVERRHEKDHFPWYFILLEE